ncbi:hypothetical protein ARMSODRAFT_975868 [Armillaria solidipes]|uniref:Uncharacterized protein n=1 Tax=Armillaria solidipes TaxID=1076256 RepID=A0A2H3BNB4_9AGAR|nr:hypothetical protein ARMSODRAFT_975868 [Armillaria solidipes]
MCNHAPFKNTEPRWMKWEPDAEWKVETNGKQISHEATPVNKIIMSVTVTHLQRLQGVDDLTGACIAMLSTAAIHVIDEEKKEKRIAQPTGPLTTSYGSRIHGQLEDQQDDGGTKYVRTPMWVTEEQHQGKIKATLLGNLLDKKRYTRPLYQIEDILNVYVVIISPHCILTSPTLDNYFLSTIFKRDIQSQMVLRMTHRDTRHVIQVDLYSSTAFHWLGPTGPGKDGDDKVERMVWPAFKEIGLREWFGGFDLAMIHIGYMQFLLVFHDINDRLGCKIRDVLSGEECRHDALGDLDPNDEEEARMAEECNQINGDIGKSNTPVYY